MRELAYAESNLCSLALDKPADAKAALHWCTLALEHMELAARRLGNSDLMTADLADRHAWLGDAYRSAGDDDDSHRHRLIDEQLLQKLMKSDPMNMDFKTDWVSAETSLALYDQHSGRANDAVERFKRADRLMQQMVDFDPSNSAWREKKNWINVQLAKLQVSH